ncbi:MAG: hypothetical protein KatS3mg131_3798 [Candidatus Tectimicrobiota bacterium]|nr:MAG: hypothetical protein KatS3mg131_3798 [Candidatus Tectomicrobia bacterium]
MELGFDTVGNATLICYDRGPVLATDPWIAGSAYFGSWRLAYEIPPEQYEAVSACPYVWFSHAHPDHLNPESLPLFRHTQILLPDHVGGRVFRYLQGEGYRVTVLKDKTWFQVSPRIRVMSIADYNQDAVLLVDIGGQLLVNLNDANAARGWGQTVRRLVKKYPVAFLLSLTGFGDADMINFYDEDGNYILPSAAKRAPVGKSLAEKMRFFGTRFAIPFSSLHHYQRQDSVWANQYVTTLADYPVGFDPAAGELLPAFIRYDCLRQQYTELNPPPCPDQVYPPEAFGDSWAEPLEKEDIPKIQRYFRQIEHLQTFLDFIRVRIGGKEVVVELADGRYQRGITFEAPRQSFMTAIEYEIFDDLLIGNFMKTTLHGKLQVPQFRQDFTPYVAKYADNGLAKTHEELQAYFREYRRRNPVHFLHATLQRRAADVVRTCFPPESLAYRLCKTAYKAVHKG